jgi:hypothetical protein
LDIWNAIFDLIKSISRITPPTSIPSSFDGTPVKYSSTSMHGDEIKNCTYRSVGGFFTKYFEGKEWSKRSKDIYQAMRDRHVDGQWIDFPDPPDESAV